MAPGKLNSKSCAATPRLFLVDGSSFIYRAYYAIRALSTSKGEPTNALYGFITMLRKLLADRMPDAVAICFDRKEPTFRHERFKEYKAHRKPMPEDLVQQLEPIKEYCKLAGYCLFEKAGYEADDIIGTLAVKAAKEGYEVFIITGDKDAMQLVNDKVKILNPHKENIIFDAAQVRAKLDGIGPEQVTDLMALMGDSSDNIPGVKGVGEKTAMKLIQEFGNIDNLIKNLAKINSKNQRALLTDHIDDMKLSKELATIDLNVPLDIEWDKMHLREQAQDKLLEFYKRYEFRGLAKEAMDSSGPTEEKERRYSTVATKKTFDAFIEELKKQPAFSFDTETTHEDPVRAHLVGMSFSWQALHSFYIPVSGEKHNGPGIPVEDVLKAVKPILENEKQKKYGQNIKYDWIVMKRHGVTMKGIAFDTMVASYLINPIKLNHNIDDIALEHLEIKKITTESLLGTGKNQITMAEVPLDTISAYACEDADCVWRLEPLLEAKLKENKVDKLFYDLEIPLLEVLAKMELNGVSLDVPYLKKLSEKVGKDLDTLTKEIYEEAGQEFNLNSPKQLGDILFDKLKMPVIRRTKTGYSTDVSVLEKLAETYELPKRLLEYREKNKLKSTYLDALPEIIFSETGLVHTSYNQTTTVTGRLSSSNPNLQNIPIRTEVGREIRKAFVPRSKNRVLFAADYSQIELRILAHLCGDKNLVKAFKEDLDVHNYTATILYGVAEKDVTREMRNAAKTINFSIIYGKSAFGLSQDLGISVSEADGFITNYFERYAAVKEYLEGQKEKARKLGYLETILGRRSYFPDINSKNGQIRQFAERAAINAPIQGSAADLIKLAMVRIQNRLEKEELESLMIMQVHDELVFDVPEKESKTLEKLVIKEMEEAYAMRVPLKVDTFTGSSWYKN